jgi:hypothetical protein
LAECGETITRREDASCTGAAPDPAAAESAPASQESGAAAREIDGREDAVKIFAGALAVRAAHPAKMRLEIFV